MTIHQFPFTEASQNFTLARHCALGWFGSTTLAFALAFQRGASPATNRGNLASNTAYSVGDLCTLSSINTAYLECTQAGTTGTLGSIGITNPCVGRYINSNFTGGGLGTTAWKWRGAYTWTSPAIAAGVPLTDYSESSSYTYVSSTFQGESLTSTGFLSSVSDASAKVTSYLAGAKCISTETVNGTMKWPGGLVVRGVTYGRDKTDTTPSYLYNNNYALYTSQSVRHYSCYITSSAQHIADQLYWLTQVIGSAAFVDCTFRTNQPDPAPFFGAVNSNGFCSLLSLGGTYIRGTAGVTAPLFGTYVYVVTGNPSFPNGGGSYNVIGGVTSGVTSAPQMYSNMLDNVWDNNKTNSSGYAGPTPHIYGVDGKAYTHKEGRRATIVASSLGTTSFTHLADKDLNNKVGQTAVRSNTVYKTGGASDGMGAFSMKCAISSEQEDAYITLWVGNTRVEEGFTLSIDVLVVIPAGSGITDICTEDLWMDVVYLDQPGTMHGRFASTISQYNCPGLIHTSAAVNYLPAGPAWTGAPAGGLSRRLTVAVSPRRAGPIYVRIGGMLSLWSAFRSTVNTFDVYIDPKPVLGAAP